MYYAHLKGVAHIIIIIIATKCSMGAKNPDKREAKIKKKKHFPFLYNINM